MFNLVFNWKYFEFLNKKDANNSISVNNMTAQQQKQSRKLMQEKVRKVLLLP